MSPRDIFALRDHLGAELKGRTLSDAHDVVSLTDILSQTVLGGRLRELSGRAVLLKLSDQLRSGLAMIELDGIARRMLLCPPDLNPAYLDALIADAGIDAVVTDEPDRWAETGVPLVVTAQLPLQATAPAQTECATEWLMLTSGTSGVPKIAGHTLEALTGAIVAEGPARGPAPVWATFYDIRRYGGLQIFLRAILSGGSMVLSDPHEALADHVARLNARAVSHISGTRSINKARGKPAMSVRSKVIEAIQQIAKEQHVALPALSDDLSLHETGFDSLAFAILVARLEDETGVDPFTISEDAAFPATVGDFVRAYENVPA
ncbi:acyl carrier protein [Bradyrhizobium diazoefficiens]|nr:hypothetical protein NK6_1976 [Bradyrhizobium diazoefficiens]